jgi:hypothetical protein
VVLRYPARINVRVLLDLDKQSSFLIKQRAFTGSVPMARNGNYVAALFVAVLCTFLRDVKAQDTLVTYLLGFMAPSPDSVIPASLAKEW